jgi:hypothetical protein
MKKRADVLIAFHPAASYYYPIIGLKSITNDAFCFFPEINKSAALTESLSK